MTKKIIFQSSYPWFFDVAPKPIPAINNIPPWFKNMTPFADADKELKLENGKANLTGKKCIPMLDAMTSGYLIPLWADVLVDATSEEKLPSITWRVSKAVFEMHGNQKEGVEAPSDFHTQPFKYLNFWRIITPPGYSILVTQPFGFRNTNLMAIPAIVDTDKAKLQNLFPVWIKKGFKGVIEKGTPIVQITPFKREAWESEFVTHAEGEYENLENLNFGSNIVNNYRKREWSKKIYK